MPITKREKANLIKQIDDLSWHDLDNVREIINNMPETENVWLDKPDTLCTDWWYKSTTGIVFKVFVDVFLTEKDNPLNGQPICVINGVTKDIRRLDGKWARITPPESEDELPPHKCRSILAKIIMTWDRPILINIGQQWRIWYSATLIDILKLGYANLMIDRKFAQSGVVYHWICETINKDKREMSK